MKNCQNVKSIYGKTYTSYYFGRNCLEQNSLMVVAKHLKFCP